MSELQIETNVYAEHVVTHEITYDGHTISQSYGIDNDFEKWKLHGYDHQIGRSILAIGYHCEINTSIRLAFEINKTAKAVVHLQD